MTIYTSEAPVLIYFGPNLVPVLINQTLGKSEKYNRLYLIIIISTKKQLPIQILNCVKSRILI